VLYLKVDILEVVDTGATDHDAFIGGDRHLELQQPVRKSTPLLRGPGMWLNLIIIA
jgi:hypothetical protein